MVVSQVITFIILIVLGVLAIKVLVGLVRIAVTSVLFMLAAGVLVSIFVGHDVVSPTVGAAIHALSNSAP